MADEFPDPDEEFDFIHQADYEALRELEAEVSETRPLSQPGPSNARTSQAANKYQASSFVTCNKVTNNSVLNVKHVNGEVHNNSIVNNRKRDYESVFGDSTPSCSKTQSSERSYIDSIPSTSKAQTCETLYDNSTPGCSKTQSSERSYIDGIPGTSKTQTCEALFGDSTQSAKRKRSVEELLADISVLLNKDISDDVDLMEEPREKKLRWSQPKDVIEAIVNARQLLSEHNESTSVKTNYNENKKNSISLRVPPWNFVAVTRTYDSQRLYIRVRSAKNNVTESTKKPIANLLSVPYKQLKAQAEEIMTRKSTSLEQPTSNTGDKVNDELWVDKYRPQSYLELLSDETVNRQLLHWLKLWDKIVFNRAVAQPKRKRQPVFGKKRNVEDETDVEEVDGKGYPIKRVVLLSGPPGLGKTTLAHIAARHAGYNVVEVNASDERTPDAFRQILLASTEMKSVMGSDPRPNCLIFDEIDGAPAASIELLLRFVHGKLAPKARKGKTQTERASDGCARPVVCICNEPYAPTLRTLRAAAVTIPVPEVSPLRLAERLMDIARREELSVDFNDLVKLAERSGCDVRACVSALQYMGGTNLRDNLSLGLKDTRRTLFDLWKNVLTVPVNAGGVVAVPERIRNILKAVQNGETEKLTQGIFHNYPEVCDRKIDNASVSLEWFQLYDLITSLVMRRQVWSLMPYTHYGFVAWHLHLARTQKMKLSYPTVISEVTQKAAKTAGIVTAVRKVCGRDAFTLTTDIACFLPDLLAPRLRTVPSHLYSPKEKADLVRIVSLMLEFGLSFAQEKNSQGGYVYALDPNIVEVGVFPDCNAHRHLPYAVQQIIAQELEVERLKRASILTGLGIPVENAANSEKPQKSAENTKNNKSNANSEASEKQKSGKSKTEKTSSLKETVYKDFFGNIITRQRESAPNQNRISPKSQRNSAIQNILTKHGVWYKYKEGCNNAVRRKVYMEKLM